MSTHKDDDDDGHGNHDDDENTFTQEIGISSRRMKNRSNLNRKGTRSTGLNNISKLFHDGQ